MNPESRFDTLLNPGDLLHNRAPGRSSPRRKAMRRLFALALVLAGAASAAAAAERFSILEPEQQA
jgi:hypothetical protein